MYTYPHLVLPMRVGAFAITCIDWHSILRSGCAPVTPACLVSGTHPESFKTSSTREQARFLYRVWRNINKRSCLTRTVYKARFKHALSLVRRILAGKAGAYDCIRVKKIGNFLTYVANWVAGWGSPSAHGEQECCQGCPDTREHAHACARTWGSLVF